MIAYKFLRPGGVGPFSGFAWPLPAPGDPGAWVEAGTAPTICMTGIHACSVEHLPIWIERELWKVELDGQVERARSKLVAPRGRLVARVDGWDDQAARDFADVCAARAAAHGDGYAADAAAESGAGNVATVAYIAAHAAARTAGSKDALAAERAWQSRWLADRLGL